ncbi:MAG: helix-hairpin-helix domain-containing protein [Bacteroidota bacterium]
MWQRFNEWLALTNTERKVILFLTGTMLAGLGLRLYRETFPDGPQFDYRSSDSTFAVLSAAPEDSSAEEQNGSSGRVNLNTATKGQLMQLPGIGETTAERILIYRDEQGRFTSVDELTKVKGISRKKLERLRPYLTLE